MHTSVAADSLVLHGLPDLIDKKLASHHQSLTRLMDENTDDFLGEVTDYVDGKVPANSASASAPAAAAPSLSLEFGSLIQSGLNRSFVGLQGHHLQMRFACPAPSAGLLQFQPASSTAMVAESVLLPPLHCDKAGVQ